MARLPQVGGDVGNWGEVLNDFLTTAHNPDGTLKNLYVNAKDFGVKGDGVADDTRAIQAAIDFCTGSLNPITSGRNPKGLFFPKGVYKITSSIAIRSVQGFRFQGAGRQATRFMGYGIMPSLLDINGSAYSLYEGFSIETAPGADCGEVIRLWWDNNSGSPTQSARSTTGNTMREVSLHGCRGKTGIRIGADGFSNQVDSWVFEHVSVHGGWSEGENTLYQRGWHVGHDRFGNNINHTMIGCQSAGYKKTIEVFGSSISWFGGAIQAAEIGFFFESPYFSTVKGIRSEGVRRLISCSGPASGAFNVSFEDIEFSADKLADDGRWIQWHMGGVLLLKNIRVAMGSYSYVTLPKLFFHPPAPLTVIIDGLSQPTPLSGAYEKSANAEVTMRGYTQMERTEGVALVTTPGPWSTGDVIIDTAGKGLKIKEGANAKMGLAKLINGSAVVATSAVTANSRIFLTSQADNGISGNLRVSTRLVGISFTISSSSIQDQASVAWFIIEPA